MTKLFEEIKENIKKARQDGATALNVNIRGNLKLQNTDKVRFIIWNIPAVVTCTHATEHCKKYCYARKAENLYRDCLPSRQTNFEATRNPDFVRNMIYTIEKKLTGKACAGKLTVFRIHESGDFYNKRYALAWLEIARHFETIGANIVFMAYTKSLAYFEGIEIPSNFVLRASVWDDTSAAILETIERNNYPIYTAFEADEMAAALSDGFTKCDCTDCANCGKCWDRSITKLACEIH